MVEEKRLKKRKRRRKVEEVERNFNCPICNKRYFSYPALYTHKRNKHNVIPITGKDEIFKSMIQKSKGKKFKYSEIENSTKDLQAHIMKIVEIYKSQVKRIFKNENSILYDNYFNVDDHEGVKILEKLKNLNEFQLEIPRKDMSIDKILILYLLYFARVAEDRQHVEAVTIFVILIREHLNVVGWDFKKKFHDFGIPSDYTFDSEFTQKNFSDVIPEFVNEFNSVFLTMDETFSLCEDQSNDLTKNFCNWLLVNNLTGLKICDNF
jgi:hypothetical protein